MQRRLNADHGCDRGFRRPRHPLRHVMDGALAKTMPFGRFELPGQQSRQHALAHAIAPDQSGMAQVELEIETGKKALAVGPRERHTLQRQ